MRSEHRWCGDEREIWSVRFENKIQRAVGCNMVVNNKVKIYLLDCAVVV